MYRFVLFGHSYLRWVVLGLALLVFVRSFLAWRRGDPWTRSHKTVHVALVSFVDLQLLIGLALYAFLSPLSGAFFHDPGAAMKDPLLRFFGMEHLVGMVIAVALFHIGRAKSKKAATDLLRHRHAWTFTLAALLVTFLAIPWPGLSYGRPMVRGVAGADSAPVEQAPSAPASDPR